MKAISPEALSAIAKDRLVRRKVTQESHLLFFSVYFHHYIKYPLAKLHHKMFEVTQDRSQKLACIVSFRGSGKSTIVTMSYAIWSILGIHQKKFVVIVAQTKHQAKQQMANLKTELENNKLLGSDLGPFQEDHDAEWGTASLVFPKLGARITVASSEQSIRGARHEQHRPDVIILDDIEDVASVRTQETRDKTFEWFTREIIPLGDLDTRIIIVGNFLHEDSLVAKLKRKITDRDIVGAYFEFPLVDDKGKCQWPEKFKTAKALAEFKRTIISETSWQREYLLKVVSDESQVIKPEWIQRYDRFPLPKELRYEGVCAGVDLAISEKEHADYTAIVVGKVFGLYDKSCLYIMPNPAVKRCDFPSQVQLMKDTLGVMDAYGQDRKMYIESVGYQTAIVQQLATDGYSDVEAVIPRGDKRSRLEVISPLIKEGRILFPREGCENLIAQMTGFGTEKHDDIADALSLLARMWIETYVKTSGFVMA